MGMKRTIGVGRHTSVNPEAPGLEPWGVVTALLSSHRLLAAQPDLCHTGVRSKNASRYQSQRCEHCCLAANQAEVRVDHGEEAELVNPITIAACDQLRNCTACFGDIGTPTCSTGYRANSHHYCDTDSLK